MSCDVGQGFLENAIQPDLDCQRQADGVQFTQCEIHSYLVGRCKLGNVSVQCDTQTMVVQHRWVKPAGQPSDLVDRPGSDCPQPIPLGLSIRQILGVLQSTQADQERSEQLAGFVMQFAR